MPTVDSDDHLIELLENDEFQTVPDYKLYQENTFWPVKESGVLVTGMMALGKKGEVGGSDGVGGACGLSFYRGFFP